MKTALPIIALAVAAVLGACSDQGNRPTPTNASSSVSQSAAPDGPPIAAVIATDAWLGDWTGPEGTGLRIDGGAGRYTLTIRNLDGPRRFDGVADGATIRFPRDGVDEVLRAGDGDATGMKWLAGKSDCLLLRAGEGWCRP